MKCHARGCRREAQDKWPLIDVWLCRKHTHKPPKRLWKRLVAAVEAYLIEQARG